MAKSLRSKSKRSFRAKKRQSGKYAAADAARLDRLHSKLAATKDRAWPLPPNGAADGEEDTDAAKDQHMVEEGQGQIQVQGGVSITGQDGDGMVLDEPQKLMAVSTHGARGSRREEWRKSKGMDPVPKRRGMNRQGGLAARRKAGKPSRRR